MHVEKITTAYRSLENRSSFLLLLLSNENTITDQEADIIVTKRIYILVLGWVGLDNSV